MQRKVNRGSISDVQPDHSRLAPLLRAILSLCRVSVATPTGQSAGALGVTEIQEASPSSTTCTSMGRPVVPARSGDVRSLADGEGRFCCGSRMSGDAHVRFCERLAVQFRGPTYPTTERRLFTRGNKRSRALNQ